MNPVTLSGLFPLILYFNFSSHLLKRRCEGTWCYKNIEETILSYYFGGERYYLTVGPGRSSWDSLEKALIPYFVDSGTEIDVEGMTSYELR